MVSSAPLPSKEGDYKDSKRKGGRDVNSSAELRPKQNPPEGRRTPRWAPPLANTWSLTPLLLASIVDRSKSQSTALAFCRSVDTRCFQGSRTEAHLSRASGYVSVPTSGAPTSTTQSPQVKKKVISHVERRNKTSVYVSGLRHAQISCAAYQLP